MKKLLLTTALASAISSSAVAAEDCSGGHHAWQTLCLSLKPTERAQLLADRYFVRSAIQVCNLDGPVPDGPMSVVRDQYDEQVACAKRQRALWYKNRKVEQPARKERTSPE
jgi:hypothetical protein